jgi:D-sedoheptulose 7-phosphate isomerase
MKNEAFLKALEVHKALLADFENNAQGRIAAAAELIGDCFEAGGSLYLCGNGGSAADCQHIAGEFVGRFRRERRALPAIALSTDTSILTCIGNDYSFNDVFKRQVEAVLRKGDVLWAFSTSGSSANIIAAAELARKLGGKVIAFTGKAGSKLESLADVCLCAHSEITSASQEIHMLAYHIICDMVEERIAGKNR